jgi:hypothetical protein
MPHAHSRLVRLIQLLAVLLTAWAGLAAYAPAAATPQHDSGAPVAGETHLTQPAPDQPDDAPISRRLLFVLIGAGFFTLAIAGGVGILTHRILMRRQRDVGEKM